MFEVIMWFIAIIIFFAGYFIWEHFAIQNED